MSVVRMRPALEPCIPGWSRMASCPWSVRPMRKAGSTPNSTPVMTATPNVNASTRQSQMVYVGESFAAFARSESRVGRARDATRDAQCATDQAHRRRGQSERDALGDQLLHQSGPAGAQRRANHQLRTALRGSREQQVGDVGARDQQHEPYHAHQNQRGPHHRAGEFFADRKQPGALALVAREALGIQAPRLGFVHGVRLGHAYPRLQPADGAGRQPHRFRQPPPIEHRRRPDGCLRRIVEARRRDADDGERHVVQADGSAKRPDARLQRAAATTRSR